MADKIKLKVINNRRILGRFTGAPRQVSARTVQAARLGGVDVMTTARSSIQNAPRGGEPYTRYKPKRTGTASAPDEPPASDETTLAQSIFLEEDDNAVIVGTRLGYGAALELGSRRGLAPRPWLRPAFLENLERIRARFASAVKFGMRF
jgi:phage gpG-like protein